VSPTEYKLLIFDWDGTLADSIGRIVTAMQVAAQRSGRPERDAPAVKGIIGLGLPEAILTLYPDMTAEQVIAFRQHYADVYIAMDAEPSPLFAGVKESLEAFREQGYRLAVATGKARRGLDRVLGAHGWEDFFDITRAADETASKPDPLMLNQILAHCDVRPDQALMVGDASFDLLMARNAGIDSVAVGYGAQSMERLLTFEPRLAIGSFPELRAWLERQVY
jgi:phosphoglycolate phosphatase